MYNNKSHKERIKGIYLYQVPNDGTIGWHTVANIEYNLENSFILSKSGTELFSTIDELINSLRWINIGYTSLPVIRL